MFTTPSSPMPPAQANVFDVLRTADEPLSVAEIARGVEARTGRRPARQVTWRALASLGASGLAQAHADRPGPTARQRWRATTP